MRNFSADAVSEIAKEILGYFFMIKLDLTASYYYTTNDIPVYYSGNKYVPLNFECSRINTAAAMSVDSLDLEFDNTGLGFSTIVLGEDARNKTATIYFGVRLTGGQYAIEEIFRGIIGEWQIVGETKVTMKVVNEFVLWNKKPMRTHSSSCQWAFKGTECAHAGGETWCDQSYDRCTTLANTDNFGGFRWLPSIVEKEIWWGRQPR
jgi:hypothetical protein